MLSHPFAFEFSLTISEERELNDSRSKKSHSPSSIILFSETPPFLASASEAKDDKGTLIGSLFISVTCGSKILSMGILNTFLVCRVFLS